MGVNNYYKSQSLCKKKQEKTDVNKLVKVRFHIEKINKKKTNVNNKKFF